MQQAELQDAAEHSEFPEERNSSIHHQPTTMARTTWTSMHTPTNTTQLKDSSRQKESGKQCHHMLKATRLLLVGEQCVLGDDRDLEGEPVDGKS